MDKYFHSWSLLKKKDIIYYETEEVNSFHKKREQQQSKKQSTLLKPVDFKVQILDQCRFHHLLIDLR